MSETFQVEAVPAATYFESGEGKVLWLPLQRFYRPFRRSLGQWAINFGPHHACLCIELKSVVNVTWMIEVVATADCDPRGAPIAMRAIRERVLEERMVGVRTFGDGMSPLTMR